MAIAVLNGGHDGPGLSKIRVGTRIRSACWASHVGVQVGFYVHAILHNHAVAGMRRRAARESRVQHLYENGVDDHGALGARVRKLDRTGVELRSLIRGRAVQRVEDRRPGDVVPVTLYRGGKKMDVQVKLVERPVK